MPASTRERNTSSAGVLAYAPRRHQLVTIDGVGRALPGIDVPGAVLTNERLSELMHDVSRRLGERGFDGDFPLSSPEFPEQRIGVRERRVLADELGARDLAIVAGRAALEDGGTDPRRVRCVIVTTVTPDRVVPAIATSVADALGLRQDLLAFDLTLGCNGFVAAIEVGRRFLAGAEDGDAVLVIGAEAMTRVLDASDRTTCSIFGDGGGAVVLRRRARGELAPSHITTLGAHGSRIEIRASEDAGEPLYRFSCAKGRLGVREDRVCRRRVVMEGRRVFRDMVRLIPQRIRAFLRAVDLGVDDIDRFAFHQANARLIEAIATWPDLGLPPRKVLSNIANVGNTTSASIPILLHDARARGRLKSGHRVLLVGFGTGYSVGITLVDWS